MLNKEGDTPIVNVARNFATENGLESGVLLNITVPKVSAVAVSTNVQMIIGESAILLRVIVKGANVTHVP